MLIRELHLGAMPLAADARQQYLDENCSDPSVREEVERLLAGDQTMTFAGLLTKDSLAGALVPGTMLGHYRIQQRLGAGGMGLVYAATDEMLRRTVAIKVLPPGNVDQNTRLRFIREAQAASALNHPNIITVFEVGRIGETDFIVMERVDGQTLYQAIGAKGLDPRDAIQYATQIAGALAAAHEANIVHRDLKPSNVMVTERGLVKVLDFGLAKQSAKLPEEVTAETSLTKIGRVVGTASYMSPEQAQGKPVDSRSDIFSFGAVLYEMLTGVKAFSGDSGIATMAAVLNKEPAPLLEAVPAASGGLHRLISKCLQKKPHDRWQSIADVKLVLEDLLKDLESPPSTPAGAVVERRRAGWIVAAAAGIAGVLGTAGVLRLTRAPAAVPGSEPVYRMLTAEKALNDYPAISKDGKFIAFASDRGGEENLDIWLQQIGGREPIRLTRDAADDTDPAFSPDGAKIAFRSEKDGGGVYVVPALGGEPVLLAQGGRNPRFSPDGRWIAYWTGRGEGSFTAGSRVFVIEAGGGQPRLVHPEMGTALFPIWSPGGDKLLVFGWKKPGAAPDWWILPVENGDPKETGVIALLKAQKLASVQPGLRVERAALDWFDSGGGRALFAAPLGDSANLWEIGLSESGTVSGPARRVTRGTGRQARAARALTSDAERTVFSEEIVNYDVWTMPVDPERGGAKGEMTRLTDAISTEWAPSITEDGREILYLAHRSPTWALVSRNMETRREKVLVSSPALLLNAQITGDGRRVVYSNGDYHIFSGSASGGAVENLCERCGTVLRVSHDGRYVMYEPMANEDLLMFDAKERTTIKLAPRPEPDTTLSGGDLSPDGKWVAFHSVSHPARATQVWIAPVDRTRPVPPAEWIPVTDGKTFAQDPCWSANGNILYFVSEQDGFRCFWGQRLDAARKPSGEVFPLRHFHSARMSLRGASSTGFLTGLSIGGNRAVFAVPELTGTIWLEEKAREK